MKNVNSPQRKLAHRIMAHQNLVDRLQTHALKGTPEGLNVPLAKAEVSILEQRIANPGAFKTKKHRTGRHTPVN
jgi:hypothetical protein